MLSSDKQIPKPGKVWGNAPGLNALLAQNGGHVSPLHALLGQIRGTGTGCCCPWTEQWGSTTWGSWIKWRCSVEWPYCPGRLFGDQLVFLARLLGLVSLVEG
ncbi:hypothetical protein Pcinc_037708 [Petrolisthes cinctipes]|uniref:Uncharacterized protein n=1 Tax=Petrolisthes cinctipes TaxID=88211 RepID=A0AAE1BS07_PETCI|nr:hypothetical protein Pcinc_037708 [Petrolisthes cinctipes]